MGNNDLPLFDRPTATEEKTLAQARQEYAENLRDGGNCPCCDRYGRIYRRKFTSAMARFMIALAKKESQRPGGWVHALTEVPYEHRSGDYAKPLLWGLIEERSGCSEEDGNPSTGFYRITRKGLWFVRGQIRVPKAKLVYQDREWPNSETFEEITIREALGAKFNYEELMAETVAERMNPGPLSREEKEANG